MEEEVKKWLKKKMGEIPAEQVSKPAEEISKPVEAPVQEESRSLTEEVNVEAEIEKSLGPAPESSKPEENQPEKEESKISAEKVWEETEGEEPHESLQEPPHSDIEKALKIPQIKDSLNADADISKIYEKEKAEFLPEKGPMFTTKSKVLMVLIVVLVAFLVSWFYFYFPR
jgi:hypothetical protein